MKLPEARTVIEQETENARLNHFSHRDRLGRLDDRQEGVRHSGPYDRRRRAPRMRGAYRCGSRHCAQEGHWQRLLRHLQGRRINSFDHARRSRPLDHGDGRLCALHGYASCGFGALRSCRRPSQVHPLPLYSCLYGLRRHSDHRHGNPERFWSCAHADGDALSSAHPRGRYAHDGRLHHRRKPLLRPRAGQRQLHARCAYVRH